MLEIERADILKRAKQNCARAGLQWEPTIFFRIFGGGRKAGVLDEFGRQSYLAEAHWQLLNEAAKDHADRL